MLPVHLEEVLYLLVNKHLWNERVIEKVLVRERLRRNSTAPSIQALRVIVARMVIPLTLQYKVLNYLEI